MAVIAVAAILLATSVALVRCGLRGDHVASEVATAEALVRVGDLCRDAQSALTKHGYRRVGAGSGEDYWKDLGFEVRSGVPEYVELEAFFECKGNRVISYR